MLQLEDAASRILSEVSPLSAELVSVREAAGRYAGDEARARVDLPGFDNSAMDGYAVRSAEVRGAAADCPVRLRLQGMIPAGGVPTGVLEPGACVRVFTGSMLPEGADAVVMQEDTGSSEAGIVEILDGVTPWEHVRLRGEDLKVGDVVLKRGERITAMHSSVLAAAGLSHVQLVRQPLVGVIATGSELREPGEPLKPGEIYESNRILIRTLVQRTGSEPRVYPVVRDELESTAELLERAFGECDLVVTCGGVSVGDFDFVREAFQRIGGRIEFWRVAMKPGKPFVFGRRSGKLLCGLPGNPVSAMITFLMLVRPVLIRLQGGKDVRLPAARGVLAERVVNPGDRRHFVRVRLEEERVTVCGAQRSHMMSRLVEANGVIDVPAGAEWPAGSSVWVYQFDA